MKRLAVAALGCALVTAPVTVLDAQSQRAIHPRSCARADSVLPAKSDALKGRVRISYSPDTNATTLRSGSPLGAQIIALMGGHGPAPAPVAQLTVFLHSGEAEIVERGEQPPVVTLVTDDSTQGELSPIKFGTFVSFGPTGPPPEVVRVPLSAELDPPNWIAIARARRAEIHVGSVKIAIRDADRRDMTALYVAMICGVD